MSSTVTMLRHNDLARLSIGRIPVGPNMLRVIEWSLRLSREAGISDQAAAHFGDILGRFVDASVLETTARGGPDPELVGRYFASLPAERYRTIASLGAALFTGDDDDRFEFGLDLLVAGLAARIPGGEAPGRQKLA